MVDLGRERWEARGRQTPALRWRPAPPAVAAWLEVAVAPLCSRAPREWAKWRGRWWIWGREWEAGASAGAVAGAAGDGCGGEKARGG